MESLPHILLIDDDVELLSSVSTFLKQQAYQVTALSKTEQVMDFLAETTVALVVIDMLMPQINGLSLSQTIKAHYTVPILMLTGVDEEENKIIALETSVDDYLTKPFNLRVLLARMNALLRRQASGATKIYHFGQWQFDLNRETLSSPQGQAIPLSQQLVTLLQVFVTHPKQMHTREKLLEALRGKSTSFDERRIDSLVSQLRQYLQQYEPDNTLIQTIRARGYRFNSDVNVS